MNTQFKRHYFFITYPFGIAYMPVLEPIQEIDIMFGFLTLQ